MSVKCEVCGVAFERIVASHLWIVHKMTMKEYREKYPDAKLGDGTLTELFKGYGEKVVDQK